jgi:hypothetical protein
MVTQYTGKQRYLIGHGVHMRRLGWRVGLARKDKTLLRELAGARDKHIGGDWDALSIIMDERLVVVDFDKRTWKIPAHCHLPPTLRERSRRGWHLFYTLPEGSYRCRIKRWPDVDLLVREVREEAEAPTTRYYDSGAGTFNPWVSHVLCSPSDGYELVWPDALPARAELTQAPPWLVDEVTA